MKENRQTSGNRREFIAAVIRGLILAIMGIFTIMTTTRRTTGEEDCTNNGICRGCNALRRCGLPAALSFKQATGGDRNTHGG